MATEKFLSELSHFTHHSHYPNLPSFLPLNFPTFFFYHLKTPLFIHSIYHCHHLRSKLVEKMQLSSENRIRNPLWETSLLPTLTKASGRNDIIFSPKRVPQTRRRDHPAMCSPGACTGSSLVRTDSQHPAPVSNLSTPPLLLAPEMSATKADFAFAVIAVAEEVPAVTVEVAIGLELQQVATSVEQLPRETCAFCRFHTLCQRVASSQGLHPIVVSYYLYDYTLCTITCETACLVIVAPPFLSRSTKSRRARILRCGRQDGYYESSDVTVDHTTSGCPFLPKNDHMVISQQAGQFLLYEYLCHYLYDYFVGLPCTTSPKGAPSTILYRRRTGSPSGKSAFGWKPPWIRLSNRTGVLNCRNNPITRASLQAFITLSDGKYCCVPTRSGRQACRLRYPRRKRHVSSQADEGNPCRSPDLISRSTRRRGVRREARGGGAFPVLEEKNRQVRTETTGGAHPNQVPFHRLYVGNIHFSITEEDLRNVFEPFGDLEFVQLQKDDNNRSRGGLYEYLYYYLFEYLYNYLYNYLFEYPFGDLYYTVTLAPCERLTVHLIYPNTGVTCSLLGSRAGVSQEGSHGVAGLGPQLRPAVLPREEPGPRRLQGRHGSQAQGDNFQCHRKQHPAFHRLDCHAAPSGDDGGRAG